MIARARARLSPAISRSASGAGLGGVGHSRHPSLDAHGRQSRVPAAVIRTIRFCARNGMLNLQYGRLLVRYLRRRLLTVAGRRWRTDGLLFLGRGLELQIARKGRIEFGRFVWIGDGTKIRCHEGVVEIGAKTVIGPGVHDLRLPAGADRRAVRDRRPGDVHRLRPRRRRGRALDPRAGHLQARRRGRLQRLDRLRRLHPARRPGRRQLDRRHQLGGHQGRPRQRRRRRHPGAGDPHARGAGGDALGASRSSPTRRAETTLPQPE